MSVGWGFENLNISDVQDNVYRVKRDTVKTSKKNIQLKSKVSTLECEKNFYSDSKAREQYQKERENGTDPFSNGRRRTRIATLRQDAFVTANTF